MKFCTRCSEEICTKDGVNLCTACEDMEGVRNAAAKASRARAKAKRKAMESVMSSMGLVKVKGALGGTYWE